MHYLYGMEVEWTQGDRHYGFPERYKGVMHMDARNARQARQLVRDTCIIQGRRDFKVGPAKRCAP